MVDRSDDPTFTARLDRWLAEVRVDEAALQRARERWLREVAEQESTLIGVLADLAERRATVIVTARGGRRHQGVIRMIGVDFLVIAGHADVEALVALATIAVVHTASKVGTAGSDRAVTSDLRLADVLVELAADRARVVLLVGASNGALGDVVSGSLLSIGHDVAVVRTDAAVAGRAYVPLAAIREVTVG